MSLPPESVMKDKLKLDYSDESHRSEISPSDGISNGDISSSCENCLNDHRTIFLCGYIQDRWHNESLNNITNELSSDFFICTNKTKDSFSFTYTRDMLRNSKTFIFLLNEYTLNDLICLLCLQYAYEIHLPIIVLRPPKTQLVILNKTSKEDSTKEEDEDIDSEESSRNRIKKLKLDHKINIKVISRILFNGYEKSIPYDRLEHAASIVKLKRQLKRSIPLTARRVSIRKVGTSDVSHQMTLVRNFNKNNYNYYNNSGGKDRQQKINFQETSVLVPIKRFPSKSRITKKRRSKSNIKESSSLVNLPSRYNDNDNDKLRKAYYVPDDKNFRLPDINDTRRSSDEIFSDRQNFKNTRYLIFNGKDPTKKPYIVNFPNDLYTDTGELIESEVYRQLQSTSNIYGNDDSDFDADRDFDEHEDKIRTEIALKVKGTLNDDDLYNFEDDIEF
uniref:Uncharacterized protein n=1 Tax=Strongyloides venezuelensis TaxID=75913 RepID=A0A0K0G1F7_STRVS